MGYSAATGYYTTYSGYVYDDVSVGIAWGCFVAYILGVVLLTYTLDMTRVCDSLIKKLGDSAYAHYKIVERIHQKEKSTHEFLHKDIRGITDVGLAENVTTVQRDSIIESTVREVLKDEIEETRTGNSKRPKFVATCCNYPDESYSDSFLASMIKDRLHWGCSDVFFKDGKFGCIVRPKGMIEDFIFSLFQRHIFLSQFGAVRGNPYSREDRRISFLFLTAFSIMFQIFVAYNVDDERAAFAVNILVISPLSLFCFSVFYKLEVCPCVAKHLHSKAKLCSHQCCLSKGYVATGIKKIGQSIAYPLAFSALGLLLIASYFGGIYGASSTTNYIKKNAYSVFLVTNGLDFLQLVIQFLNGRVGYNFHLLGVSVEFVGKWFMQYVDDRMLKEGVEYDVSTDKNCNFRSNKICGVVKYSANKDTFFSMFGHEVSETADLLLEEMAAHEAIERLDIDVSEKRRSIAKAKKERVKGWMRVARFLVPKRTQIKTDEDDTAARPSEVEMTSEEVLEAGGSSEAEERATEIVEKVEEALPSPEAREEKPSLFKQLSSFIFDEPADRESEEALKPFPEEGAVEHVVNATEQLSAPVEEKPPAPAPAPGIFKQLSNIILSLTEEVVDAEEPTTQTELEISVEPEGGDASPIERLS